jgi:lactam utilization protein B
MTCADMDDRAWTQDETASHIKSQLEDSSVIAVTGERVSLSLGDYNVSLCCHSDSPGAIDIVKTARKMVDEFNQKHHGSSWFT